MTREEIYNESIRDIDSVREAVKAQRTVETPAVTRADKIRALRQEQRDYQEQINTVQARIVGLDAAINNDMASRTFGGVPALTQEQADGIRSQLQECGRELQRLSQLRDACKRQGDA